MGLNINDSEKKMDPGLIYPQPGAIYMTVYYHNIQTSPPLKSLGQTMPNFIQNIYRKGHQCVYKNPGHMARMGAMPKYDNNPSKIFFSRSGEPISTKHSIKHR